MVQLAFDVRVGPCFVLQCPRLTDKAEPSRWEGLFGTLKPLQYFCVERGTFDLAVGSRTMGLEHVRPRHHAFAPFNVTPSARASQRTNTDIGRRVSANAVRVIRLARCSVPSRLATTRVSFELRTTRPCCISMNLLKSLYPLVIVGTRGPTASDMLLQFCWMRRKSPT